MSREEDIKPTDDDDRAIDLRITEYLKLGVPAGTVACAVAAGYVSGAPAVVLVLAGGALVAAITIFWASIRTLVGETPLSGADAYALGAPNAEEEQKRAVLRALKDLEFEHSVGKISEEDYQALVAKYRAEAKRLLRTLDEDAQPQRAKVEVLVQKRLEREGLAEDGEDEEEAQEREPATMEEPQPEAPKVEASKAKPKASKAKAKPEAASVDHAVTMGETPKPPAQPDAVACAKCGTKNDVDAVFCKKCGARQGAVESANDDAEHEGEEGKREETST